jgi:hypothetical protein
MLCYIVYIAVVVVVVEPFWVDVFVCLVSQTEVMIYGMIFTEHSDCGVGICFFSGRFI